MATSIEKLTTALRAIPTQRKAWDANQALSWFTHATLQGICRATIRLGGRPVAARCYEPLDGLTADEYSRAQVDAMLEAADVYLAAVKEQPPFTDVLTLVHAEALGRFGGNGLGQHFTPWDLADLKGELVADHYRRHPLATASPSLYEPTSGAGGLVLGQLRHWKGDLGALSVVVNDLDPLCSAMTALQLLANQFVHNKPLRECAITVGNALVSDEKLAFASVRKATGDCDQQRNAEEEPMDAF